MWLPRAGEGGGDGELLFNGFRVSVLQDAEVLETDGGDGGITIPLYLMPLNCTLKTAKMVGFVLCVLYHHFFNSQRFELTVGYRRYEWAEVSPSSS